MNARTYVNIFRDKWVSELKGCRMKGKKGKCAICGKYGQLTFEHSYT